MHWFLKALPVLWHWKGCLVHKSRFSTTFPGQCSLIWPTLTSSALEKSSIWGTAGLRKCTEEKLQFLSTVNGVHEAGEHFIWVFFFLKWPSHWRQQETHSLGSEFSSTKCSDMKILRLRQSRGKEISLWALVWLWGMTIFCERHLPAV